MSTAVRLRSWIAFLVAATLTGAPACAVDIGDHLPASGPVAWAGAAPTDATRRFTLMVLFAAGDPIDRAIMPRMTDLAHRHPEVLVEALSADGADAVRALCRSLGAKVAFPVGAVSTLDALMPPVGLPCVVLADARGTVVWWGHPLDAPRPLADALDGELRPTVPSSTAVASAAVSAASTAATPACRDDDPACAPPALWEEAPVPAPMRSVIIVDPWWCWTPAPLGWHAHVPLLPFGRDTHGRGRGRDQGGDFHRR